LAAPERLEPMIKKIKPDQQYHSILCFEGPLTCLEGPYLIAAARFVDYVTLHIVSGLIPDIIEEIGEFFLDRKLGVLVDTSEFPPRPVPSRPVPSRLYTFGGAASATNTPRQGPDKFLALMDEADDTSKRRDELKSDLRRFKDAIEKIVDLET